MLLLQYEVQETLHHLHENEGYQEEIRRGRGRVEYAIVSCFPKKKMQNLGNGLSVRACLAGNAYQFSQGKLCTTQLPCKCRFWYSLVNAVPCKCGLWLKCSWLQLTQHNLVLLTPNLPAKIIVLFGSNLSVFRWHRAFASLSRAGRQAEACGHWGLHVLRAVQLWESKRCVWFWDFAFFSLSFF